MRSILNESVSIFDAVSSTAKEMYNKKKQDNQKYYLKGSISKYAKDLIMTFPVLADNTVSMNTLNLINKAHEKNVVTMLELLFTNMMVTGANGRDALAAIHKNIDNMSLDDVIDAMSGEFNNSAKFESAEFKALTRKSLNEMTEQLRSGAAYKTFKYDSINEKSLNNYIVRDINGNLYLREAINPYPIPVSDNIESLNGSQNKEDRDMAKNTLNMQIATNKEYREQDKNRVYPLGKPMVTNGEIKKANELQPTLMVVNVAIPTGNTIDGRPEFKERAIVTGVKSRIISVESLDIVERIVSKNKSAISFKNFIRATSGEINFLKDFLFNIKQAKINAKNAVKKGPAAKMWDVLEKRSIQRNASTIAKFGNDGSAIAALVINQETVNYLKSQFKIDLENPKVAAMFMNAYCLLALIIADEVNEVAKFIYDGNSSYELVSYTGLSKEAADKEYKKLVNLINNGGR